MRKIKVFALIIGFACVVGATVYSSFDNTEIVSQEVTITQGQTLYQVVAETVNEKNNINEVVSRAMRDNGIKDAGKIQPNQKITITYKK